MTLHQNEPNPFNPSTTIRYEVDEIAHVRLAIYSASGARVRTLVDDVRGPSAAGHAAVWDGRDERGEAVASGVYFCRLDAGGSTLSRKMLLLK